MCKLSFSFLEEKNVCLVETHCELHGIQGNYADIVSLLLKVPQGGEIEHSIGCSRNSLSL